MFEISIFRFYFHTIMDNSTFNELKERGSRRVRSTLPARYKVKVQLIFREKSKNRNFKNSWHFWTKNRIFLKFRAPFFFVYPRGPWGILINPWGPQGPIKNTFKNKVQFNIYPFFGETFEAPPNGIRLECRIGTPGGPWAPGGAWDPSGSGPWDSKESAIGIPGWVQRT